MKTVIDDKPMIQAGYLKLVFFRSNRVESISFFSWLKLWFYELLFGVEILEQCLVTSVYNDGQNHKRGQYLHLSDFVPTGMLTNLFRQQIYQLLYYKFYKHYTFLEHESSPNESAQELDLKGTRFAFRHEQLFQLIAFRRVYILQWIIINISVDVVVWSASDFFSAVATGVVIETLRRLIKL